VERLMVFKQFEIMPLSLHGSGRIHNQALAIDDNLLLDRMPFLFPGIVGLLLFRILRPLNGLFGPVNDGLQIGVKPIKLFKGVDFLGPLLDAGRFRKPALEKTSHLNEVSTDVGLIQVEEITHGRDRQIQPQMHKAHEDSSGQVMFEIPSRSHGSLALAPTEPFLLKLSMLMLKTQKHFIEGFKRYARKASELIGFLLHFFVRYHGKESSAYDRFFPFIDSFKLLRNGSI
jgi:hypothetical protein